MTVNAPDTALEITSTAHAIPTAHGALHAQRWHVPQAGSGAKAPIVLLHDSLGCVALWRDFPLLLARTTGRDVIAYDRLGFGQSAPAPRALAADFVQREARGDFAAVRAHFGLERFALLGHSVGGGMAAYAAAAHPGQCVALITESAQSFVEDRTLQGIRAASVNFAQPGQLERLAKHHGDKAAWVLSAWVDTWLSAAFADFSMQPALQQVHCPVLALHGDNDEFGSLVHPRNIAAWAAGPAEQEVMLGTGHVPHREQPERVAARIAQWLQALA